MCSTKNVGRWQFFVLRRIIPSERAFKNSQHCLATFSFDLDAVIRNKLRINTPSSPFRVTMTMTTTTTMLFSAFLLFLSFKTVDGFLSPSVSTSTTATTTTTPTTGDYWRGTCTSYSEQVIVCYSSILQDPPTDASTGSTIKNTLLNDDVRRELQSQNPNENAPAYDFYETDRDDERDHDKGADNFSSMTELDERTLEDHKHTIRHDHFETRSLDDLFPNKESLGFSEKFNSCARFRNELRDAMRHDIIFDSNADGGERIKNQPPIYSTMTNDQRYQELAKNKPLIGYWKQDNDGSNSDATIPTYSIRMTNTTEILRRYLGPDAPTGDSFFEAIGSLCNSTQAPYHWTEVVGVAATQNSKMGDKTEHAWHQDYGHLEDRRTPSKQDATTIRDCDNGIDCHDSYPYQSNNHVFLAFPFEDNYHGTGVFSHLIKLKHEQWAKPKGHLAPGKSIFYTGIVPDRYIVRPRYVPGSELIVFRDIDVLHSTPDIQYRTSIMRFG